MGEWWRDQRCDYAPGCGCPEVYEVCHEDPAREALRLLVLAVRGRLDQGGWDPVLEALAIARKVLGS